MKYISILLGSMISLLLLFPHSLTAQKVIKFSDTDCDCSKKPKDDFICSGTSDYTYIYCIHGQKYEIEMKKLTKSKADFSSNEPQFYQEGATPGGDKMAHWDKLLAGFDIFQTDPLTLKKIKGTQMDNIFRKPTSREYHLESTNVNISTPRIVDYTSSNVFSFEEEGRMVNSYEELKWALDVTVKGKKGPWTGRGKIFTETKEIRKKEEKLAMVLTELNKFTLTLNKDAIFSKSFVDALHDLPTNRNTEKEQQKYKKFLQKYGTHYVLNGTFGEFGFKTRKFSKEEVENSLKWGIELNIGFNKKGGDKKEEKRGGQNVIINGNGNKVKIVYIDKSKPGDSKEDKKKKSDEENKAKIYAELDANFDRDKFERKVETFNKDQFFYISSKKYQAEPHELALKDAVLYSVYLKEIYLLLDAFDKNSAIYKKKKNIEAAYLDYKKQTEREQGINSTEDFNKSFNNFDRDRWFDEMGKKYATRSNRGLPVPKRIYQISPYKANNMVLTRKWGAFENNDLVIRAPNEEYKEYQTFQFYEAKKSSDGRQLWYIGTDTGGVLEAFPDDVIKTSEDYKKGKSEQLFYVEQAKNKRGGAGPEGWVEITPYVAETKRFDLFAGSKSEDAAIKIYERSETNSFEHQWFKLTTDSFYDGVFDAACYIKDSNQEKLNNRYILSKGSKIFIFMHAQDGYQNVIQNYTLKNVDAMVYSKEGIIYSFKGKKVFKHRIDETNGTYIMAFQGEVNLQKVFPGLEIDEKLDFALYNYNTATYYFIEGDKYSSCKTGGKVSKKKSLSEWEGLKKGATAGVFSDAYYFFHPNGDYQRQLQGGKSKAPIRFIEW